MKIHITTNTKIDPDHVIEYTNLTGDTVTIEPTKERLKIKYHSFFDRIWGNFDWIRAITPKFYDARVFVTTASQLRRLGITDHIALYDNDPDSKYDLYIGLNDELDARAKKNGFKSNLAWELVHEILHGRTRQAGVVDDVHEMEEKGRLKELLFLHMQREKLMQDKISLLTQLKNRLLDSLKKRPIYPIDKKHFKDNITQGWLVANNLYKSGYHNGLDIRVKELTPIRAMADGRIYNSDYSKELGYYVMFECEIDGRMTYHLFPHLNTFYATGSYKQGDIIGRVGGTGLSFGSHVHWTVLIERPNTVEEYVDMVDTRDKIIRKTLDPHKFIAYAVDRNII